MALLAFGEFNMTISDELQTLNLEAAVDRFPPQETPHEH